MRSESVLQWIEKFAQLCYVSVSLILVEVVEEKRDLFSYMYTFLKYNVSITAKGQDRSAPPKTLELCTQIREDNTVQAPACTAYFPLPSPGEVLRSEKQFLEIEEANSLLQNDAMILELKLLQHKCHEPLPQWMTELGFKW